MNEAPKLKRQFDPAAFQVDPTLRGLPLASYSRRLAALVIDLALVALLTQTGGLTLSTLIAIVVFWLIIRSRKKTWWSRLWRGSVGLVASFFVFILVLSVTWDGPVSYGPNVDWGSFSADMASSDPAVQAAAIAQLEAQLEEGFNEESLVATLESFGVDMSHEKVAEAEPLDREELILQLEEQLAALRGGEDGSSADPESVRKALLPWVAGVELEAAKADRTRLIRRLGELQKDNLRLQEQVDHPSFKYAVQALASDLGLTMGWAGIYFTLFLVVAAGRTPGKWLMGLRVARVDGSPLSAWSSFERFAGYAAGLATGMLGFLQVFWDRNGQSIQDSIAGTVVLDDRDPKT